MASETSAPLCAACGKPAKKKCSRCWVCAYCSPVCQKADWPSHKLVCSPKTNLPKSELENARRWGKSHAYDKSQPHSEKLFSRLRDKAFDESLPLARRQALAVKTASMADPDAVISIESLDQSMYHFVSSFLRKSPRVLPDFLAMPAQGAVVVFEVSTLGVFSEACPPVELIHAALAKEGDAIYVDYWPGFTPEAATFTQTIRIDKSRLALRGAKGTGFIYLSLPFPVGWISFSPRNYQGTQRGRVDYSASTVFWRLMAAPTP